MDVVNAILKPVFETLMVPVKKHLGYLISCRQYVREMGMKMSELNATRLGVEEHMNRNTINGLEVPAQVRGWLEDVRKINVEVEDIPSYVGTCFNLKMRHKVGRKAFKIIEEIESATRKHSDIMWTDHPIPLGKVDSIKAFTSTSSNDQSDFESRELTFMEALKALDPNHRSHMIALWGMGGVGKTKMMQRLKKVVQEKKMFNYIVEVVIRQKTDPIAIQDAVADYLDIELKEKTKQARAEKLHKRFMANSDGGKNKFLVILDDVWQFVDLNDIGLSPLPNQGVNFKVLLTSRDRDVCTEMGAEANSIFNVKILKEKEAQSLFCQFVEVSDDADPELHKIGVDIVRRCCGLPIAIKTMACTLRGKSKDAWKNALSRLEHYDIHNVVNGVFETSYDNLQDEESKSVFLLCGLFPEDFNIPTEELMRYGWGLNLFKRVYTIREARTRLNTCIERLIHTNLLMETDDVGCVKMHDLVLAFVLDMFSKLEHASIVNHGSMTGWPENDMDDSSCKRISLTCKGMTEFPRNLKFPNLSILKLMHGGRSLRFPQNFFEEMEKLKVISYEKMKYMLLPSSPQCSIQLRVLHLHECSLMFDFSCIGNLLNLEVLSFADSGIKWLPSTFSKLKKLRLLDLTHCVGLRIDSGVLKSLVKLEELYMKVLDQGSGKAISFTDDNYNEMAERSKKLSAFEFEFFENNAQPKNMSFENLERFKISVGCSLDGYLSKSRHSFKNTLRLITNKTEILESRMNELFEKTEELYLCVDGMNDLEDVEVKSLHPPQSSSFYNLRVLIIVECEELRYLFTLGIAKSLLKLEHLEVESCSIMEELIHTESSGEETITFPKLKFLSLEDLENLSALCHNINIIELPQLVMLELDNIPIFTSIYPKNELATSCFFNEQVVAPKLEKLSIGHMQNLKEIWPCEFSTSEEMKLREIKVKKCDKLVNLFPCNPMPLLHHLEELRVEDCGSLEVLINIDLDSVGETGESNSSLRSIGVMSCDKLVNLFPCNPMPLLHHLEKLRVEDCGSIEVLFNIDLDSVGDIGEGSSNLKSIQVYELEKLREVWRIKGENNSRILVRGFQSVEFIEIGECKRFRNLFTPTTTNFDLGALKGLFIDDCGERRRNNESVESSQQEEIVFPSCLIRSSPNLRTLEISNYEGMEVVFEIESPRSRELVTTQRLLPCLKDLNISRMERMNQVWKCNWNKILFIQKQLSESPFHNLTTIYISECKRLKYLFSPLMAKFLSNLKEVEIKYCGIEEVVSNRDDEDEEMTTSTHTHPTLFPCLDSLTLIGLKNLKHIGGGGGGAKNELSFNNTTTTNAFLDQFKFSQVGGVSWTLCQYSGYIRIWNCHALSSVIPSYAAGQMQKLQVLKVESCHGMKEVFETQRINNNKSGCDEVDCGTTHAIQRPNDVIMLKLPNLKILEIYNCGLLEHVFTFSAVESLGKLEELRIKNCKAMKVIVKEEDGGEQTRASKEVVVFPRLKSIALVHLPDLLGFFLGKNDFQLPLLDDVKIIGCPQMIAFTRGLSIAPKLKYIQTGVCTYGLERGLNFHETITAHHQQTPIFSTLDSTSLCPVTSEGVLWSFHNLIELDVRNNTSVEKIIPSKELLQLQKLEKIHVEVCDLIEEVFEALEGTDSGLDESQTTVVKLPNLRVVELYRLVRLRYIWKSNQWTVFEFPNLTRLFITRCNRLEYVFTSSMVGSLLQLQELCISECNHIEEVITKDANAAVQAEEEEESDGKRNEIVLPCLKSLVFEDLSCLKGFYLGNEDFSLPLLNTLRIKKCPAMSMFTMGNVATPELIKIKTSFGSFYGEEDINSFIKIKQEEFKRNYDY